MAVVLDSDGVPLSGVDLLGPLEAGRLILDHVDTPRALLTYCFGRGERQILLSVEGTLVRGRLETRWEGNHRSWWLELDE